MWFNFALAKELGLTSRASLQPALERDLIDAFSLQTTEQDSDRYLHADAYGGTGIQGHLGSGRGGYLDRGDLFLKGVGRTPLCRSLHDFNHSHGGATLVECIFEAIFGEINHALFTSPSARILAIIDQGRFVEFPDGGREPLGVSVRAGTGLRPAHVLTGVDGPTHPPLDLLCRIADATGQLVRRGHHLDLRETALRILRAHARTAAEQFRWRMLHGAICTSNMRLDGGMLDNYMQSALPRTARVRTAAHTARFHDFGIEHLGRSTELRRVYDAVRTSLPHDQRRSLRAPRIDFHRHMARMYAEEMTLQWICAAGVEHRTALRVRDREPTLTARFAAVLDRLARLPLPRKIQRLPRIGEMPRFPGVDAFALLAAAPAAFIAAQARRRARLREALAAEVSRSCSHAVDRLLAEFVRLYPRLVTALVEQGTGSRTAILRGMELRTAAENRPMDRLFRPRLYRATWDVLTEYVRTNERETIAGFIEETIQASRR